MTNPRATVIITQRERFGMTAESLESLYEFTDPPFDVVYVDGGSPEKTRNYLASQARQRGYTLVRREKYLTPNQARNLGLKEAKTEYVAFVDNDVIYTRGWLEALIRCADETGAAVVAPLICHAIPPHEIVHHVGGDYTDPERIDEFFDEPGPAGRNFSEVMHGHNAKLAEIRDGLKRDVTGFCEFHCVLARRNIFDKIGPLDEMMLSTKEHIDFSMAVRAAGEKVWFEPASLVTYVFPSRARPLEVSDWPFFCLRWSDDYGSRTLKHFIAKWKLNAPEGYVAEKRTIYSTRRYQAILLPMASRLPLLSQSSKLARLAARVASVFERPFNRALVAYHSGRAH
jgi:GT2 family glycosyltransferase